MVTSKSYSPLRYAPWLGPLRDKGELEEDGARPGPARLLPQRGGQELLRVLERLLRLGMLSISLYTVVGFWSAKVHSVWQAAP